MDFSEFVLSASTADLADATDPVAREHADAVELRMDLAEDPLGDLAAYEGDLPVLATNRVEWEGGRAPDDDARLDDLVEAAAFDAVEAIDVELEAMRRGTAASVPDRVDDEIGRAHV